ncbi:MAG: hypothetical protein FWE01_00790 [Firmicutes bacterium]|nr:hypothetical protein [Bacillota bacterium]
MQKVYIISGTRDKEKRLPYYFETTDRNIAEKNFNQCLAKGYDIRLEIDVKYTPTEFERQYARKILGI